MSARNWKEFRNFQLERASLGRQCSLGQIYDTAMDTFVGSLQHSSSNLNLIMKHKRQNARYTAYCMQHDFAHYFKLFGVDNEQLLSLLLGVHQPCPFLAFMDTMVRYRLEAVGIFVQTVIENRSTLKIVNDTLNGEDVPVVEIGRYFTRKVLFGKVAVFLFLLKERKTTIDMHQAKVVLNAFLCHLKAMVDQESLDVTNLIHKNPVYVSLLENVKMAAYFNGVYEVGLNLDNICRLLEKNLVKCSPAYKLDQEPFPLAVSLLPVASLFTSVQVTASPRIDERLVDVLEQYQCRFYRADRKYRVFRMEMNLNVPRLAENLKRDTESRNKEIMQYVNQNVLCLRVNRLDFNLAPVLQMFNFEIARLESFENFLLNAKVATLDNIDVVRPLAVESASSVAEDVNGTAFDVDPESLIPAELLDIEEPEADVPKLETIPEELEENLSPRKSYASILKGASVDTETIVESSGHLNVHPDVPLASVKVKRRQMGKSKTPHSHKSTVFSTGYKSDLQVENKWNAMATNVFHQSNPKHDRVTKEVASNALESQAQGRAPKTFRNYPLFPSTNQQTRIHPRSNRNARKDADLIERLGNLYLDPSDENASREDVANLDHST